MAERQNPSVDLHFLESLYACEIVGRRHPLHPCVVVVSDYEVLAPVERLQDRLDLRRPEEQVAKYVDGVVRLDLCVPFGKQRLVHLLDRPERTAAEAPSRTDGCRGE